MRRKCILWVLVLATAGGIFWFSSQSALQSGAVSGAVTQGLLGSVLAFLRLTPEQEQIVHEMIRSAAHVAVFAILGLWVSLLVRCYTHRRWWLITAVSCAGYAVFDECYQQWFSDGRMFEWVDIVKDTVGALLAVVTVALVTMASKKRAGRKMDM